MMMMLLLMMILRRIMGMRIMRIMMMMLSPRKLSFLWTAGAEMSHEGWVQNAHKDRLIYQVSMMMMVMVMMMMMAMMLRMMIHCINRHLHHQLTSAWEKSGLDVLLCPAFAMPAAPNSLCSRLLPGGSSSSSSSSL